MIPESRCGSSDWARTCCEGAQAERWVRAFLPGFVVLG